MRTEPSSARRSLWTGSTISTSGAAAELIVYGWSGARCASAYAPAAAIAANTPAARAARLQDRKVIIESPLGSWLLRGESGGGRSWSADVAKTGVGALDARLVLE